MQNKQQIHTADIKLSKPEDEKFIKGEFSIDFETNGLNFTCSTQNVEFEEVEAALIKLRDEIQRQLDNKHKCPFYKVMPMTREEERNAMTNKSAPKGDDEKVGGIRI